MLEIFSGIVGVNDGEAVLLGLMMERPFHFLASNDKTAMKAVAADPKLKDVRKQVAGRVYCMELLIEKLIATKGPEVIAQRFAPLMTMEKTHLHNSLASYKWSPTRLQRGRCFLPRRPSA